LGLVFGQDAPVFRNTGADINQGETVASGPAGQYQASDAAGVVKLAKNIGKLTLSCKSNINKNQT
jgi:hypothetical protein